MRKNIVSICRRAAQVERIQEVCLTTNGILLPEAFMDALMAVLQSDIPCIGVMKGPGPASNMIRKLGLGDACVERSEWSV